MLISAVREGHAAFCSAGSQPCAAFARISSYLPKKHLCIRQIVACIGRVIFVLRAALKKHFVLFYQRLERFDDAIDFKPFHFFSTVATAHSCLRSEPDPALESLRAHFILVAETHSLLKSEPARSDPRFAQDVAHSHGADLRSRSCPKWQEICLFGHSRTGYSISMPTRQTSKTRHIGFVLFDGLTALDLVGPMEAFAVAGAETGGYKVCTVGLRHKTVVAESGLIFKPQLTLAECPRLDTLIIPGGEGLRRPAINTAVAAWIKERAPTFRRVASVCTGIFGLAPTGLLDGRSVTTHWRFAREVAQRFPALRVVADSLFVKDGKFYTSAGITAGIDLSLALIEEDMGRAAALRVARELVVYMKRAGGQAQYSEPLRNQAITVSHLGEVAAYIDANLGSDLSVEILADISHLSARQFGRRFREAFHTSPAAYVKTARLNHARHLLCTSRCRISQVATMAGFASEDAFRRAFERQFGLTPTNYRHRFGETQP